MIDFLFELTNYISLITVVQLLSFSFYLILTRRKDQHLLGFFLIANSSYILDFWLLRYSSSAYNVVPDLYMLFLPFGYLFGPLLYAYTLSVIKKKTDFKWKFMAHAIPFILVQTYRLFFFHVKSFEEKTMMIKDSVLFPGVLFEFVFWGIFISSITYIVFSLRQIREFKFEAKENLSSIEKLNISWLNLIVFGFLAMWGTDLSSYLLSLAGLRTPLILEIFLFISLSINLIFANLILFKGLRHPELLHENWVSKPAKAKYESSNISEENKKKIADELKFLMENNKPYLEPDLTLNELAEILKIHPRTLSQVINEKIEMSFYDFVNGYRINEACAKLADPEFDSETILGVLLESGFNSKSVFNTLFKKTTGITPTEYRRRVKKNSV